MIPIPGIEKVRTAGIPIKLNRTPGTVPLAPPRVREHTDEALPIIGRDAAAIAELRAARVVA